MMNWKTGGFSRSVCIQVPATPATSKVRAEPGESPARTVAARPLSVWVWRRASSRESQGRRRLRQQLGDVGLRQLVETFHVGRKQLRMSLILNFSIG